MKKTKIDQIIDMLTTRTDEKHDPTKFQDGDLFQKITKSCDSDFMSGDLEMELIDDPDYYGCNFTGDKKVYMLFFRGSSDYFPAIWIGNDDINKIDQMPIYILDLSCGEQQFEQMGNLKSYINDMLDEFLLEYNENDEYMKEAIELKKRIENLSNNLINKGDYILDINDEF